MKTNVRAVWALTLALAVAACDSGPVFPEDVTFDAATGVDLATMTKLPSGVYYKVKTPGTAPALTATDRFTANYRGMLANGKQFDGGILTNYKLSDLIPGFAGIVGMMKGETRLIVIPSELGYGGEKVGEIPANSVLVFEVTLVQINP
jgi:FKBP-type peptidyl-prolyl cis-trans isomerase FkpA